MCHKCVLYRIIEISKTLIILETEIFHSLLTLIYLVQITYVILPPQHVHEDIFIPQIICSYSSHNTFHDIESDNVCYLEKNNFLVLRSNDQN